MGGGEIVKKGWLKKSPPLEGGGIKAWRKRFFCLRTSKVMEYYKGEDGDLKGVVNLEDCKAVHSDLDHKKYKYVFDIETKDRTYYLVASSSEDMKSWVDTICNVCGFNIQIPADEPPLPSQSSSKTLPTNLSSPNISAPTTTGGIPLSERFKPSQNGTEELYSLATAVGKDVHKQLSGDDQDVPSGVPLSEALAYKGLGSTSQYSPTPGSAGLNPAVNRTPKLSNSSYFTPRQGDGPVFAGSLGESVYSLYQMEPSSSPAPVPKPRSATLMPSQSGLVNPIHKPLTVSQSAGLSPSSSAGPTFGSLNASRMGGATEMENGYMRPRPINRVPDYDYPPFGPPRPAFTAGKTSPKQHRSALLQMDPADSAIYSHEYVNIQRTDLPPPPIDRSNKPTPPVIDRSSKPRTNEALVSGGVAGSPSSSDSSDSPFESPPARSRLPSTGLAVTEQIQSSKSFSENDIPKPTKRTTQYTQVQFDPNSQQIKIQELEPRTGAEEKRVMTRGPVPVPRKRVSYSDVDLDATTSLAGKNSMSLREAELQHLQERPYVNVDREGVPDDDADPDYYTHMRNLTMEDADRPEYVDAIYALAQEQFTKPTDSGDT